MGIHAVVDVREFALEAAVDIEAHGASVVAAGDVRPLAERRSGALDDVVVSAALQSHDEGELAGSRVRAGAHEEAGAHVAAAPVAVGAVDPVVDSIERK